MSPFTQHTRIARCALQQQMEDPRTREVSPWRRGRGMTEARYALDDLPDFPPETLAAWWAVQPTADWELYTHISHMMDGGFSTLVGDEAGQLRGYMWEAHAVRHRLLPHAALDWQRAVQALQRAGETCVFSRGPVEARCISMAGVGRLMARFGVGPKGRANWWSCDDCVCWFCGRPVEYPLFCCLRRGAGGPAAGRVGVFERGGRGQRSSPRASAPGSGPRVGTRDRGESRRSKRRAWGIACHEHQPARRLRHDSTSPSRPTGGDR